MSDGDTDISSSFPHRYSSRRWHSSMSGSSGWRQIEKKKIKRYSSSRCDSVIRHLGQNPQISAKAIEHRQFRVKQHLLLHQLRFYVSLCRWAPGRTGSTGRPSQSRSSSPGQDFGSGRDAQAIPNSRLPPLHHRASRRVFVRWMNGQRSSDLERGAHENMSSDSQR